MHIEAGRKCEQEDEINNEAYCYFSFESCRSVDAITPMAVTSCPGGDEGIV